jgi:hypothetical protein
MFGVQFDARLLDKGQNTGLNEKDAFCFGLNTLWHAVIGVEPGNLELIFAPNSRNLNV